MVFELFLVIFMGLSHAIPVEEGNAAGDYATISGISSGGFMAAQMHVAYSSVIRGSAIYAGGPYYCAQNSLKVGLSDCCYGTTDGPDLPKLIELTDRFAIERRIDPLSNLQDDPVFIFVGKEDTVVDPMVTRTVEEFYRHYNVTNLFSQYDFPAQHTLPTIDYGVDCEVVRSPYLGICNYDSAGAALQHLYGGTLLPPVTAKTENLREFDQTPFISKNLRDAAIAETGFVYVPTACQGEGGGAHCRLHLSLHGCNQNSEAIGSVYAEHAGFNSWAESNDLIVMYPNTANSNPSNPQGCWDWWGYTGPDYAFQSGVQMEFLYKIATSFKTAQILSPQK